MFWPIVKDLYIGKSKLQFFCDQKELKPTTLVLEVLKPTGYLGNMPDYGTYGNYQEGKFEITSLKPKHQIYVTGIPKGAILDNFRLQRTFWSSYYEDDLRGYLFQVIDGYPKLIIPKLIIKQ